MRELRRYLREQTGGGRRYGTVCVVLWWHNARDKEEEKVEKSRARALFLFLLLIAVRIPASWFPTCLYR